MSVEQVLVAGVLLLIVAPAAFVIWVEWGEWSDDPRWSEPVPRPRRKAGFVTK